MRCTSVLVFILCMIFLEKLDYVLLVFPMMPLMTFQIFLILFSYFSITLLSEVFAVSRFFAKARNLFPRNSNFKNLEILIQCLIFVTQITVWRVFGSECGRDVEIIGIKIWFLLEISERQ